MQEADGVRIPEVLVPFMGGITFLPFVRDARGAPTVPAVPKPLPAAAPSKAAPAAAAPAPAAVSGPEAELTAAINAVGEEVRALKAAKVGRLLYIWILREMSWIVFIFVCQADKAVIQEKVANLLALKAQFQESFGSPAGAAPADKKAASTEEKKEKSKDKLKADKKPAAAAAPAQTKPAALTASSSVWNGSTVDTALLEAKLKVFSYVAGYEPSAEDNRWAGRLRCH